VSPLDVRQGADPTKDHDGKEDPDSPKGQRRTSGHRQNHERGFVASNTLESHTGMGEDRPR